MCGKGLQSPIKLFKSSFGIFNVPLCLRQILQHHQCTPLYAVENVGSRRRPQRWRSSTRQLLRGCYNSNPPRPKYSSTWDPSTVISFITSLEGNESLPLSVLTGKVVVLLALATLFRVSDLFSISLRSVSFSISGVSFSLLSLRKSQRDGPLQSFSIPRCPDPSTCPVTALQCYLDRTLPLRSDSNSENVFVTLKKPHLRASPNTIARWIKTFLHKAGVDTNIFSAHSTRGASASKAASSGLSIDVILKTGHWSSSSTFYRFYNRQSASSVAQSVISSQHSSHI